MDDPFAFTDGEFNDHVENPETTERDHVNVHVSLSTRASRGGQKHRGVSSKHDLSKVRVPL